MIYRVIIINISEMNVTQCIIDKLFSPLKLELKTSVKIKLK